MRNETSLLSRSLRPRSFGCTAPPAEELFATGSCRCREAHGIPQSDLGWQPRSKTAKSLHYKAIFESYATIDALPSNMFSTSPTDEILHPIIAKARTLGLLPKPKIYSQAAPAKIRAQNLYFPMLEKAIIFITADQWSLNYYAPICTKQ